jgi:hypothetical protein
VDGGVERRRASRDLESWTRSVSPRPRLFSLSKMWPFSDSEYSQIISKKRAARSAALLAVAQDVKSAGQSTQILHATGMPPPPVPRVVRLTILSDRDRRRYRARNMDCASGRRDLHWPRRCCTIANELHNRRYATRLNHSRPTHLSPSSSL